MKTRIISVHPKKPDRKKIEKAAAILRKGGIVGFPTETVYGLGAGIFSSSAIKKLFKAKGRPNDNPLIVHIASKKQLKALVTEVPPVAVKLMKKFWPGPLTLILYKSDLVPSSITAGLKTVAVRMPAHPVARALIRQANMPVAAPSANRSGKPSPTDAGHVLDDLNHRVDCILDGGASIVGLESTVLDLTSKPYMVLRPGAITVKEIRKIIGTVKVYPSRRGTGRQLDRVKSPGMKYRHYAPKARLFLWEGRPNRIRTVAQRNAASLLRQKQKVALVTTDLSYCVSGIQNVLMGSTAAEVGRNLYLVLRMLDREKTDVILAVGFEEKKVGLAVMNRLRKAADRYSVLL